MGATSEVTSVWLQQMEGNPPPVVVVVGGGWFNIYANRYSEDQTIL